MKALVIFKVFILLPLILFIDYVLMVLIGCSTCLIGLGGDFYCGSYCILGKLILGLSAIFFFLLLLPDIKRFYRDLKNRMKIKWGKIV